MKNKIASNTMAKDIATDDDSLVYQAGYGNSFESEVIKGSLPRGRNNPRKAPFDLYAEQLSGTAFTRPRHVNQRTWLYRQQPSVAHNGTPFTCGDFFGGVDPSKGKLDPNPLRWMPFADSDCKVKDFVSGVHMLASSGEPETKNGLAALKSGTSLNKLSS